MTQEDYQLFENMYLAKINKVDTRFVRYLYKTINWDVRLIGIKGARGVGKTTLLLQRIKMAYKKTDTVFYVSLDNLWFQSHSLPELADWLYLRGIRHLFLDEVHKYPNWAIVIKNLYDTYDDLNIVYTGSSMLEIDIPCRDCLSVSILPSTRLRMYGHCHLVNCLKNIRQQQWIFARTYL